MKIQSLSIHVPTNGCVNNCMGCVSRMHRSPYKNRINYITYPIISKEIEFIKKEYLRKLHFTKENGVNNIILTGIGEPLQNKDFLKWFGKLGLFRWIELQTAGNMLLDESLFDKKTGKEFEVYSNLEFLQDIGVSTISLSLWDMFDSQNNDRIVQMPVMHGKFIDKVCKAIKDHNFNLRLSLNMTDVYNNKTAEEIFARVKELGADQVTFRKLYKSPEGNTKQDKWIDENTKHTFEIFNRLDDYILGEFKETIVGQSHNSLGGSYETIRFAREDGNGKFLGVLPFGTKKYSVNGITTVIDDNCMDDATKRENLDTYKYLILRPNCKLYSNWDDPGSLIF